MSIQNDPSDVTTAAKPTNAWNAATVCGNYVTATLFPSVNPTAPPAPNRHNACVSNGAGKLREHKAVKTPVDIPMSPKALPTLAVACEASPLIPPMQHRDAARYPIWYTVIDPV